MEFAGGEMNRVDAILRHPLFGEQMALLRQAEENRVFCRHGMTHLLDVARIAWIINLEEGQGLDREVIYACALLHDIGKARQYLKGIPHEKAGGELAPAILKDCGFTASEAEEIKKAILSHRDAGMRNEKGLCGILYRADKASRACFDCPAEAECNWSVEKKNMCLRI